MSETCLQSDIQNLRRELKEWERQFALANNGRKATRDEIKATPDIAAKYKEYNALSGKAKPHPRPQDVPQSHSPKRKRATAQMTTPRKVHKSERKPTAEGFMEQFVEGVELTPTVKRTFVGPTPQKDGRVLGLFDMLSPAKDTESISPSKRTVLGAVDGNAVMATPSKRSSLLLEVEGTPMNAGKHSRTPQSVGKRFMLDKFITPSKRSRTSDPHASHLTALQLTPQSMLNDMDMFTPAFLRRDSRPVQPALETLAEGEEGEDGADSTGLQSPSRAAPRRARVFSAHQPSFGRSLSRSLSSMIADIRKAEEDQLDEEMELLRDLETGDSTTAANTKPNAAASRGPPMLLAEDSQKLGPDGASDSEQADEEPVDLRRRTWKKKGQKRQTRRVILKPIARLPKPTAESEAQRGITSTVLIKEDAPADVVAETNSLAPAGDNDVWSSDGDSENDVEEDFSGDDLVSKQKHTTSSKASGRVMPNNAASIAGGLVDRVRKVGASAHANYCRLKIRSAKGAAGAKSKGRFGRRK